MVLIGVNSWMQPGLDHIRTGLPLQTTPLLSWRTSRNLAGVTDWADAMANSADSSKYPPSWGGAGGILAGYDRTKIIELCEITREEAVKMFALHRDSGYLCQYAKATPLSVASPRRRFPSASASPLPTPTLF